MSERLKISGFTCILGACIDRFCTTGYREPLSVEARLELAAKVHGLRGVELLYPTELSNTNVNMIKDKIRALNLELVGIMVDLFSDRKWMNGSFTNQDKNRRAEAIRLTKETIDMAKNLGVPRVEIWPGQDGFDYPFETDYEKAWRWMIEGLRECAEYDRKIQLCLEYKPKEPRKRIFLGSAGKVLLITNEIGLKNVGGILDTGHALYGFENLAESAILLNMWNRLFHVHLNDNYRDWDHDLIVGTVHFWELLELMFWLREIKYEGWFSLDVVPVKEDPVRAWELSITNLQRIALLLDKIDIAALKERIQKGDVTKAFPILQDAVLPKMK